MLGKFVKGLVDAPQRSPGGATAAVKPAAPAVLNVGGNRKAVAIPEHYAGWRQVLLDIDPKGDPDIECDAREILQLAPAQFDAVYCSHNLEHHYRHDVPKVLAGFAHVLTATGFAEVRVPDLPAVFRKMLDDSMDLEEVLYQAPAGPIRVIDVIYGWGPEIERTGNPFFAHKTGFSRRSLHEALLGAGFTEVWNAPPFSPYELRALAFKQPSTTKQRALLGIPLEHPGAKE